MPGQRFEPKSFCAFAASLGERWPHDESAARTAMSRAYYGALIEARDAARVNTRGKGGHQRVIDTYSSKGSREGAQIARDLGTLRGLRECADYEPHTPCSGREAYQAVALAHKVLMALSITPEPARAKLVPKEDPGAQAASLA